MYPPARHTRHVMHPISWCMDCGTEVVRACSWRTNSKHPDRTVCTFCTHTEVVKRHHCPRPIIATTRMVNV